MGNHTLTLTRDIATLCYLRRIVLLCLPSPGVDLEKFRVCIQMFQQFVLLLRGESLLIAGEMGVVGQPCHLSR